MKNTPEYVNSFLGSIIGSGSSESEEILKRIEKTKSAKLAAAEAQFAAEYEKTVKSSVDAIRAKNRKIVSQKSVEYKRDLYRYRESLISRLMDDTLNAVRDYTATQPYIDKLAGLCAKAEKTMSGRPFTIFLRPEDLKFAGGLKQAAPDAQFAEGAFSLGGIQARSTDGRLYLDETFDSAAENLRANFNSYFSLTGTG